MLAPSATSSAPALATAKRNLLAVARQRPFLVRPPPPAPCRCSSSDALRHAPRPSLRPPRWYPSPCLSYFRTSTVDAAGGRSHRRGRTLLGKTYDADDYTNVPDSIAARVAPHPKLPYTASHPLSLLRTQIESHFAGYEAMPAPSPVVSTELNFGLLGFPPDHPGRSPTDTYYLNRNTCLRTHTSAHEVDVFAADHTRWLLTADVYRRDEIDASHYPIFHQMEGASVWHVAQGGGGGDVGSPADDAFAPGGQVELECERMERDLARADVSIEDGVDLDEAGGWQPFHLADPRRRRAAELSLRHLKATLNGLALKLFGERHAADVAAAATAAAPTSSSPARGEGQGQAAASSVKTGADQAQMQAQEPLRIRWIAASFPFTSPSLEVEVWFRGKWLEILGCGVIHQRTMDNAGRPDRMGWAFGLGLERIAMVLYSIPDIRLFWSKDPRFLSQFAEQPAERGREGGGGGSGGGLVTFRPFSRFPPCYKDVSFWLPATTGGGPSLGGGGGGGGGGATFHENDLFEIVRDSAHDLVETVERIDAFVHPRTGRRSLCYRVNYRSMERSLDNDEVNAVHAAVVERVAREMGVEIR